MSSLPIITATGVCPISLATLKETYACNRGNSNASDVQTVLVLHQVEHVFVVEQPDEVEGAEAGGGSKRQVPYDHGAAKKCGR